jgi:hypothetical protein
MAVTNILAYYDTGTITPVKSFIVQAPVANVVKLLCPLFTNFCTKLVRLLDKAGKACQQRTL